jgi:hypothetical protein
LLVKVALDCAVYVGRHLTAMYRQHPGSTSAQAERDGLYQRVGTHAARADFLAWVRDYVTSRNSPELSTVDALAVAEARQSGDRSALNPRQRRLMRAVVLRRVANKLIRRARRLAARLIGR